MLALIDHDDDAFFNAYRLNFKKWRIVDIDNFMDGNGFFDEIQEESLWEGRVDEKLGKDRVLPYLDPEAMKEDPSYAEKYVIPMVKRKCDQIEHIDTKNNRNMTQLHKLRAKMLSKKKEPHVQVKEPPK